MSDPTPRRRPDPGVIVALAWAMVAVAVTTLYGEQLGLRGWIWLGIHHVACGLGCTHELWRGWQRRAQALSAATSAATPPA